MNNANDPVQTGQYHDLILGGTRGRFKILTLGEEEIEIPAYEVPETCRPGDTLKAFVYLDGKQGLKATTVRPKAELGDFAALTVKSVTDFGVFLDWGIKKDLFVPKAFLRKDLEEGDTALVCLIPDFDKMGVVGSCQIDEFLEDDTADLKEQQKVELLVFGVSDLGFRVIVNNRYRGLLYRNEVYEELRIGDSRDGFIKKIRDDGLVDTALQPQGFKNAYKDAEAVIMGVLGSSGGFLPLHDKSDPDDIRQTLQMSKKIFKKTIGVLYKEKKILIEEGGIRLLKEPPRE
ncbi:S1-like domain-containing RNA-binding protein [Oceanispirochaeta sp.]|jgi:predicted RNA-binding protein (virulence factor B family)|uniref:CvfB family protein n=1 Tax=Oceanispirochaeta sp. TaxID=2035350 RepID=UPI00260AF3BB|nr:S1-like domain-containing RNA-binding protein [Oceanispirochaeta sp.]MDA3957608.1 S1-like domain-containing RNA-binding protein [Oceanispirochaeta sp.]